MNKKNVISKISVKMGLKKYQINAVLNALYDTLLTEMQKGEEITFSGFGKFFTKQRGERKYISFQTGEVFASPPHLVPAVKFSKQFIEKF